jgi:hypothetical protein
MGKLVPFPTKGQPRPSKDNLRHLAVLSADAERKRRAFLRANTDYEAEPHEEHEMIILETEGDYALSCIKIFEHLRLLQGQGVLDLGVIKH